MQHSPLPPAAQPIVVGRYTLYDTLARGGMAAVHVGRLASIGGFARTVAIKRLHPNLAADPDFVTMLLDEARMVTRIRHPNVVQTLDVVSHGGELLLVMDYVEGESLSRLLRATANQDVRIPIPIAVAIAVGVLEGLHAAHEAKSDSGQSLDLVHRDVSPQNVLVGTDGVARLIDFGVAKAVGRSRETESGQVKGKLSYMSPEQIQGEELDRRTDIFALSIVLWEMLTGERLFAGKNEGETIFSVLEKHVPPPSERVGDVTRALDAAVMRGLSREPSERFATALDMAHALEAATLMATPREVAKWVREVAGVALAERAKIVARVESLPQLGLAKTEPELPRLPPMDAPPPSVATRFDGPASAAAMVTEPGTLTQASSVSTSIKRQDSTRALWVVVSVVGLGVVIGALVLVKNAAKEPEPAKPLVPARTSVEVLPTATAAPEPTPSASIAPPPSAAPPAAPKPSVHVAAKPAPSAAPSAKPRSSLYGRE